MQLKISKHVMLNCSLKIGQRVKVSSIYGMGKVNGKRTVIGGKIFKIIAISRPLTGSCETGIVVTLAKDLILDSNWVDTV